MDISSSHSFLLILVGLLEEANTREAFRSRKFCYTYNSGRQSRDIFTGRRRNRSFLCQFPGLLGSAPISCPTPSH
ncbi:uncharacterized protein G2W53_030941 [Senna tora]|uniref:Secreted protein n=1 Tax=Senna tora TaxID=362788 RepID=A0A834T810_9FABA|nr:uncharacterized protein G2W53_030941 [Senna tora]